MGEGLVFDCLERPRLDATALVKACLGQQVCVAPHLDPH